MLPDVFHSMFVRQLDAPGRPTKTLVSIDADSVGCAHFLVRFVSIVQNAATSTALTNLMT
jgi:hypothetical protein